MPIRQRTRISPNELQKLRKALIAIQQMDDFQPHNPAHSAAALTELDNRLAEAVAQEIRAANAAIAARTAVIEAQWALYNGIIGARPEVKAQYGEDSPQVKAVGMIRKSDRKRPSRDEEEEDKKKTDAKKADK